MKKLSKVVAGLSIAAAFGAAVLPLSAFAVTGEGTVTVEVDSTAFLAIDNAAEDSVSVGGVNTTTLYDNVWAGVSSTSGYTLSIAAKTSADINLVGTSDSAHIIDGAAAVATPAAGVNSYTWGISDAQLTTGASAATIGDWSTLTPTQPTTTAEEIASTAASAGITKATADQYGVRYGVAVATDQDPDTYTATNVFTVTANN